MVNITTQVSHSQQQPSQPQNPQATSAPQKQFKSRYLQEIQSMLYVYGDVKHASIESAGVLEELVHEHLVQILRDACTVAARRGARTFGTEDLLFYLRGDLMRVARMREYLGWREVRKNAKPDDSVAPEALVEEVGVLENSTSGASGSSQGTTTGNVKKRPAYRLPWALSSFLDTDLLQQAWQEGDDTLIEAIDGLSADRSRQRAADQLTRTMSREEYLEYTEAKQASFTYKKLKKFREWLTPASITDYRVSDEVLEVLGLLGGEMVEILCRRGLQVKTHQGERQKEKSGATGQRYAVSLFSKPSARTPLLPDHIHIALKELKSSSDPLFPPNIYPRYFV